ncbi:hypothetical protein Sjap_025632 [Stephania japonica]|uniref:Uncharacterized protein n=1 Tax=Stephania japonica TaxID=461633 RepID=A0AAP0E258_9MAGN
MPQVNTTAKNFVDKVETLPTLNLDKLYDYTFICEAILRFGVASNGSSDLRWWPLPPSLLLSFSCSGKGK